MKHSNDERYQKIRQSALVGALSDISLGILKIIFGITGHSQALITDGFHSLADLFADFMVIIAAKWGSRQPDLEHPYGHGRIETLGTLMMAVLIIIVGVGFGYDAIQDIKLHRHMQMPGISVLIIAIISILLKEYLYHYTLKTTQATRFDLAHSNAWHHRSDALASLVVLIGVLGSMAGFHHADSIAAILVSAFIAKVGFEMIWNSLRELVDTGVDAPMLSQIQSTIQETPGVLSIHLLRTRSMGNRIFVDVHILVSPIISVSEGHYIGDQVSIHLKRKFPQITDITLHIDPENDEFFMVSSQLPDRKTLESQIETVANELPFYKAIENIELHYLAGKVMINLVIGIDEQKQEDMIQLTKQYKKAISDIPHVAGVGVFWVALPSTALR